MILRINPVKFDMIDVYNRLLKSNIGRVVHITCLINTEVVFLLSSDVTVYQEFSD